MHSTTVLLRSHHYVPPLCLPYVSEWCSGSSPMRGLAIASRDRVVGRRERERADGMVQDMMRNAVSLLRLRVQVSLA
jgi:hypothetical protein